MKKGKEFKIKLEIKMIRAMQKIINENLVKIGKQLSNNQKNN